MIGLVKFANGQSNLLNIQIKNQPQTQIMLGKVSGDKFTATDSAFAVNGFVQFRFPNNTPTGLYRLILGKTRVAEIMNEPPQQLDFIFNHENIVFETDFKAPEDSLRVVQSEENKVWFEFKKQQKEYKSQIRELEMEVNYFQASAKLLEAALRIEEFNLLQKENDSLITKTIGQYPNLFAAKLIKMYREPFLDGTLSEQQRKDIFKTEFFTQLDFTDEALINTSIYTEKAFQYLMAYAQKGLTREQQEQEFVKAVEVIIEAIHPMTQRKQMNNSKVYELILDYLVRGFEKMNLENVLKSIAGKYEGSTCQTDEKTTLERRLAFLKYMTVGATVSDFTLNDVNGDPVTLSQIKKGKTLLVFWASWCPHCNEMIPQIKNWQKQQNQQDLEIVAISLDSSETEWKNKVRELDIESWYNLSDLKGWDGEVATEYNIYATPTLIIIGKDRKIISLPVNLDEFKSTF
jgi:thiol-disulfide isomerase/thioredoxin